MESIYIITPCFNASATIEETLYSVFGQVVDCHVYYHVQDGGSSDGTQAKLEKFSDEVKRSCRADNFFFSWCSRKDNGMYHAINLAVDHLQIPENAFMGWINADDLLCEGCFAHLLQVTENFPQIHWVGGQPLGMDMSGNILFQGQAAWYNPQFIQGGLCDGRHWNFIQQEGTFWRKSLWDAAGGLNSALRLAGDWDLWRRMARHASYVQLPWNMGVFRKRPGQLSQDLSAYLAELESILPNKSRRHALRKLSLAIDTLASPSVTVSETGKLRMSEMLLPSAINSPVKVKTRMLLMSYGLYSFVSFCQIILRFLKSHTVTSKIFRTLGGSLD